MHLSIISICHNHLSYLSITSIIVLNNGTNYATGNTITIDGANLGGSSNLVLTITNISVGDVINLDSGIFKENLPLRVPANTTIKGSGLRSTFISPNSGNSTTIATVTVSSGGVGGSNRTYNYIHQLSTNGSGNGAVFNITKSGGSVTAVTVYHGGYGYATANTITIDNSLLGGGTNLTFQVATLELNNAANMLLTNDGNNITYFSLRELSGEPVGGGYTWHGKKRAAAHVKFAPRFSSGILSNSFNNFKLFA
jgi:hypothetical protein